MNWTTQKRKINELLPYDKNPRQMSEKQNKDLEASLLKFDLVEIPAINTDNTILAGHQRLRIMQALGRGEEEIDVRVPDRQLTEKEVQEYNIRSNKNIGEWDWDIMANNFDIGDLLEWGFDEGELKIEREVIEDEAPEVSDEPAISQLGEVYQLGRHRLMCGDSTKIEDVEKLMNGQKAQLIMSDPPYNVEYTGGSTNEKERKDSYKDEWTDEQYTEFLQQVYSNSFVVSDNETALMIWFASAKMRCVMDAFENSGWVSRTLIVWNKLKAHYGALGAQYKHRFEPLWYCYKKGKSPRWYGETNEVTVWDYEQPSINDLHPTMKPVALYARAIKNHTKPDDYVYENFGGSGTTLIACEQTNRTCYMMELSPSYIDVIIKRWEKFTGKKAELVEPA